MGFPGSSAGKESACHVGDPSLIPGLGRSPGEGIGYPLQCSWASLVAQMERIHLQCRRPGLDPWVGKIPWRREHGNPLQCSCLENPPWTEEPGGLYSPSGHKELDTTKWLSTAQIRTYTENTLFRGLQSQLSRALFWKNWLSPPPCSWHTASSPPAAAYKAGEGFRGNCLQ